MRSSDKTRSGPWSLFLIVSCALWATLALGCNQAEIIKAQMDLVANLEKDIQAGPAGRAVRADLVKLEVLAAAKEGGAFFSPKPTENFPLVWGDDGRPVADNGGGDSGSNSSRNSYSGSSGRGSSESMSQQAPAPSAAFIRSKGKDTIIAVFDIEDGSRTFSAQAMDQLTDYYAAKLTEALGYRVVPRSQLRGRLVQEKTESFKQCYEQSCQIEIGRAIAAQKSVATKIIKVGRVCAITSTMYDLKTETAEKAASAETQCSEDALISGIREIVKTMSQQ